MGTHFKLRHLLGSSSKYEFSVLIPLHSFFVSSENLVLNQHISEFTFIFLLVTCELEKASNM